MAKTTIKIDGLRDLGEAMRGLSADVNKKIAFAGVLAGANVIKKKAIAKAPKSEKPHFVRLLASDRGANADAVLVQPGNLKKNIVNKRQKSPLTAEYIVTVRGKKKDGYAARYGRLVEFGTVHHAPEPFLRPAFDTGKEEAVQAIASRLDARVKKAQATK